MTTIAEQVTIQKGRYKLEHHQEFLLVDQHFIDPCGFGNSIPGCSPHDWRMPGIDPQQTQYKMVTDFGSVAVVDQIQIPTHRTFYSEGERADCM
jgi:hypothetical protein